jgi:glycosyltransferase involved in cell wall biosynthesis
LKVMMQSRTTLFSVPGGDTTQIVKTAEALKTMGCKVDITTELEPSLVGYDVIHLFNLVRPQELYIQALNARRYGKPIALSTIFVDYSDFDRHGRTGIQRLLANVLKADELEYLKVAARVLKNGEMNKGTFMLLRTGYNRLQKEILSMSDVLLPNSDSEMKRISSRFPECSLPSYVIVPNAVDEKVFDCHQSLAGYYKNYEGCVLCVARIEGNKCQLNLVRAMHDLPWQLVLVGKAAPNHRAYYEQVRGEAGRNVHILGQIDHNLLPSLYKAAKVHCLVSWMETTGLSSLEAGAMGCNLVITEKGDTRDYFQEYPTYCEPDSVNSIKAAIIEAYHKPRSDKLQQHILSNYTWEKAATKTIEGYLHALQTKC